MKSRLVVCAAILAACGCATKTRMVEVKGMYLNSNTGCVAIGAGEVVAVPEGTDSAAIKYQEDTAWLAPSVKTHSLKVLLTGTNCVAQADAIVKSLCEAFVSTAPALASVSQTNAKTALDTLDTAAKQKTIQKALKAGSTVSAATNAVSSVTSAVCEGGNCTDTAVDCPDGSCSVQ